MPNCVPPKTWDYYSSGGTLGTFGTPEVKDPVQGVFLKNCSLIAALASLAWKGKIITQPPGPNITYSFQFYPAAKPQKTDGRLPLDSFGNLMHAKSDTPTEIWPALYEKAYYQWLENLGLDNESSRPNYCSHIEWQDPTTVLFQLTGKTVIKKSCTDWNTVFNDINGFSPLCGRSLTNGIINSPAVAWTYNPNVYIPPGVVYSDATIAAQHTYSLLGVVKLGVDWTQKYIVLRNPYGKGKGDPNMPGYLYTAAWCNNIILGESDGIFALRIDQFVKYFEKYAWTTV